MNNIKTPSFCDTCLYQGECHTTPENCEEYVHYAMQLFLFIVILFFMGMIIGFILLP